MQKYIKITSKRKTAIKKARKVKKETTWSSAKNAWKIHLKANQNHNTSSNEVTFKLYDLDDGENWNDANKTLLGTKVISGTAKATVMVGDFQDLTTTGASGTNVFQAGDLIGISLQNSQNLNITTKYIWSFVFELDFNSY